MTAAFRIGQAAVAPGGRATIDLPVSQLASHLPFSLTVHVVHGSMPGPVLFVSGAVHGDEIVGVEIIRRVLKHSALEGLAGTLVAVPIVNTFGFLNHSRYMPDRRDLNRSFPGHDQGSLASLLADLFMREVVTRSHYGIDFHSAGLHRTNLPQIRITPDDPELLHLAETFGPPVILISRLREGTLRYCARERGVRMLLFEGGEALRFDEVAIRAGVVGVLRVMKHLAMISGPTIAGAKVGAAISHASSWIRAPEGGLLRTRLVPGDRVQKSQVLGEITDAIGGGSVAVVSDWDGIIVGRTNLPIVHRGDALFHIARVVDPVGSQAKIGRIEGELVHAPMFDEDEII
jgi:hypothetical protein